ncbi:MAG: HEAT repeat domain-containing protein [Spirochaetota bacterium]
MKRTIIFVILLFFLSNILLAQESIEQYLLELKGPKVEDYIKLLYEGTHEGKLLAVTKLREMNAEGEEVVDALIFGLQQGTMIVQRELNKVVNDFRDVRAQSALALGEIGDPRALHHLHIALTYDPDTIVRSSVAIAIGKIGEPSSVPILYRTIETATTAGSDDLVVRSCVEALGDIGHRDCFTPLVAVIRSNFRRSIRLAAFDALKKIRW